MVASTSAVTGRSSTAGWTCQKFRGTRKKSAGAIAPPSGPGQVEAPERQHGREEGGEQPGADPRPLHLAGEARRRRRARSG